MPSSAPGSQRGCTAGFWRLVQRLPSREWIRLVVSVLAASRSPSKRDIEITSSPLVASPVSAAARTGFAPIRDGRSRMSSTPSLRARTQVPKRKRRGAWHGEPATGNPDILVVAVGGGAVPCCCDDICFGSSGASGRKP
jgi:hypothetical protein